MERAILENIYFKPEVKDLFEYFDDDTFPEDEIVDYVIEQLICEAIERGDLNEDEIRARYNQYR